MPTNGQQIILSHFCRKINRSWSSSQMWCKKGFQEIFLYKGEKLQVEEASFMINHGAQPLLARRTYSMQLIAIPWPCCCIEYTWEVGKNTWCEEYIFHYLIVALPASPFHNAVCLVQQAAQTYRMVVIRNSKWVGNLTKSTKAQTYFCFVLGSQSAHLLPSSFATSPTLIETWIYMGWTSVSTS